MDQYTYERYNRKALKYLDERRYEKALKYFNRLVEVDYNNKDFWIVKGFCHVHLGDFQGSLECFDRAISIDPMDSICWLNKGNALASLGRFKGAIKCFDKALEFNPTDVSALNLKGLCLCDIGKYEEAIDCYKDALDLDPYNEVIMENRIGAMNALDNENLSFDTNNSQSNVNNSCINCGYENMEGSLFCSGCGKILKNKNNDIFFIICSYCYAENAEEREFCESCGKSLKNDNLKQKLDVNTESEEKISSLPGIGPILAKKTTDIRESKGGFESVEEFCISLNLKPHKTKIIENIIMCSPIKRSPLKHNSGRRVEF